VVAKSKSSLKSQFSTVEEKFVFKWPSGEIFHFNQASVFNERGNLSVDERRSPRVLKRGLDVDAKVEPDEKEHIDHVCFFVHGIGEGCDLRFRSLGDCVDDFRDLGASMIDAHLKSHVESANLSGRVEFIPISWHHDLHRFLFKNNFFKFVFSKLTDLGPLNGFFFFY
jgi:hypothetical protein